MSPVDADPRLGVRLVGKVPRRTGLESMKLLAIVLAAIAMPRLAAAQPDRGDPDRAAVFAVNVAIGGLTAGAARALAGGSFLKPLLRGSVGGGVVYAGKAMVGRNDAFTTLVGRGVAAVGASEVRNASAGRPMLQKLVVPFGPVHIYVDRKTGTERAKLDLSTVLVSGYLAFQPGASFDLLGSVLRGTMVFENPDDSKNFQSAGAISITRLHPGPGQPGTSRGAIGHEMVHVLQSDFMAIVWGTPAEAWALAHLPGGKTVSRYVVLGVMNPVWAGINSRIDHVDRPWEKEARVLSR